MNGITILSATCPEPSFLFTFAIVIALVALVVSYMLFVSNGCYEGGAVVGLIGLIALCCSLLISCWEGDSNENMRYEIAVDDSVTTEQLIDKYEIIESKGNSVYIVKEKESRGN